MIHDIALVMLGMLGGQILAIGALRLGLRRRRQRLEDAGLVQGGAQ